MRRNFVNAEKLRSKMVVEGKLNCYKCIHFLITPMKEVWVYERLFFELFIVIVNDKKVHYGISNVIRN